MQPLNQILQNAFPPEVVSNELNCMLHFKEELTPGFNWEAAQFSMPANLVMEDTAIVQYITTDQHTRLVLQYCISGQHYCNKPRCKGQLCNNETADCDTIDRNKSRLSVFQFEMTATYFEFLSGASINTLFAEASEGDFMKVLPLCAKTKLSLEQVIHNNYENGLKHIFLKSRLGDLILYINDLYQEERAPIAACKFLTNNDDRDKILMAKEILTERLDSPITIKELSRKVAMNECYLKRGFKAVYGKTIYDYFQQERIAKARQLLYENGLSVSEVANHLGFSSISHFSTAFKKHTGMKPCELLLR